MDYLHFGKENGEAFVILPGLALKSVMGSAEGIKTAYALLADQYDIYLFDHIRTEPEGYSIVMILTVFIVFLGASCALGSPFILGKIFGALISVVFLLIGIFLCIKISKGECS